MMKQEFEQFAGYEVSEADYYNIIEPMYYASKLSKAEFIQTLNPKRFALRTHEQLINEMKKLANTIKKSCDYYIDNELWDQLQKLANEYTERFFTGCIYTIRTKTTAPYNRGCSFPAELVIFARRNYETVEEITLATPLYETSINHTKR